MQRHGEMHVVAEGGLGHLEELRGALASEGILGEIVAPPKDQCSS